MKKRRIVLASLLKPVNDTRMFEKMGVSLERSGQYDVHIIGYPSTTNWSESNVRFHLLPKFKRISFDRILSRLKVLQLVIKLKPELLIVTTPELLGVAILIRILFGAKIIYDIQENYWRNILFTNAFPKGTRTIIACLVRFKEIIASPFITQFILAEKGYLNELTFIKNKFIVIENKCQIPQGFQRNPNNDFIQLIFTGTIAESTGIFQVIGLVKKLHVAELKIRLTIIGYCAQPKVLRQIEMEVSQNSFISLIGGKDLIPHSSIMNAIGTASFGIVYYPLSPHTENKIPTKLYEYLACQLPILLQNNKPWEEMCFPFNAAITIDFEQPAVELILRKIHSEIFYAAVHGDINLGQMTWESEEGKLLNLINNIF